MNCWFCRDLWFWNACNWAAARPARRRFIAPPRPADVAEIHGVRPYQPGEGGRRIHWRATARTGELHVIEWEEETASDLTILLDTSAANIAGETGHDTLEQGITAAASVAAFLLENGQRARLVWWADEPATGAKGEKLAARLVSVEARHRAGLAQILTGLAKIAPCQAPGASLATLSARVQNEARGAGALLLGSDRAPWNEALAFWQGGRDAVCGLAFDAASFEPENAGAGFTLRAGGAGALTATMQRAGASKTPRKKALPPQVRRVMKGDSLAAILERAW